LATAAQDPLFFAHHGNIDRIWNRWLALGGGRANPTSPDWLNMSWTFFDENSRWVSIKAVDVVNDEADLRYRYNPPQILAGLVAVAAAEPTPPSPEMAPERSAPAAPPLTIGSPQENLKLGPDPLTQSVTLPEANQRVLLEAAPRNSRTEVIRISGVKGGPGAAAIVRVFVNLPNAAPDTSVSDPHYVGYFTLVPGSLRGSHGHSETGLNVELPLRSETRALVGREQDLSVTLVPVVGDKDAPANLDLTIGSISLTAR
jgi:hypothetical protein